MVKQEFVIINGRAYSPVTGMPIEGVDATSAAHTSTTSEKDTKQESRQRGAAVYTIHRSQTQHATTLNRRHVKRPTPKPLETHSKNAAKVHATQTPQHVAVQRFATPAKKHQTPVRSIDRPAQTHPVMRRAKTRQLDIAQPRKQRLERTQIITSQVPLQQKKHSTPVKTALKPASILKNEAISDALAREITAEKPRRQKKTRGRFGRWLSLASAGAAVMLLGGYFTYLSMPNISIRVAAVQSGIDAKYPGYSPDGYSLRGPIAFKDGEVTMKFAYVGSDLQYTLTQQKSSWDSSAVKEYVTEQSGTPTTTTVDGLTLYTSGTETTWVNGGILYQINGDAVLSGEQIRKIATSM